MEKVDEFQREGFWQSGREPDLPTAESRVDESWPIDERNRFLIGLEIRESEGKVILFRGISKCRLCSSTNGNGTFISGQWKWPTGYRHYVLRHKVRPTPEFEAFCNAAV